MVPGTIAGIMKFAAIVTFAADLSRLPEVRPLHRAYQAKLRDAGKLALSGACADLRGGMNIFEAESEAEVEALMQADPFTQNGVFASWEIRGWNITASNRSLLPD